MTDYPHITLDTFVSEFTKSLHSFSLDLVSLTAAGMASGLDAKLMTAIITQSMEIDPMVLVNSFDEEDCIVRLKEMGL